MCEYISISLCYVYCILQDCNFKNSIGKIIYHCIIWYFIQNYTKHHLGQYFLNVQVNHDPLTKVNNCHTTRSQTTNNNTTKDDWNEFSLLFPSYQ
jgi:hypothetical protein